MDTVVRNVQEVRAGEDGAYLLLFKTVPEPVASGRLWWKEPETGRTGELRVNVREGGSVRQEDVYKRQSWNWRLQAQP